jgi:hypothetical protein
LYTFEFGIKEAATLWRKKIMNNTIGLHPLKKKKGENVMKRSILVIILISTLFLLVTNSMASEEEFVPWQSVRIESTELKPIGKVILTAHVNEDKISSLEVTVFGRSQILSPEQLAKLKGFPLSSISITHEAGYEKLGGPTLHCKFKREYYNNDKDLIQEHAYISFVKNRPKEVSVTVQSKTLKKGKEQSTATDANQQAAERTTRTPADVIQKTREFSVCKPENFHSRQDIDDRHEALVFLWPGIGTREETDRFRNELVAAGWSVKSQKSTATNVPNPSQEYILSKNGKEIAFSVGGSFGFPILKLVVEKD